MGLKKKAPVAEEKVVTNAETTNDVVPQDKERAREVSTQVMNRALALVSDTFNLSGDYHVTGFVDKGNSVKISVEDSDYSLDVVIKRPYDQGVYRDE